MSNQQFPQISKSNNPDQIKLIQREGTTNLKKEYIMFSADEEIQTITGPKKQLHHFVSINCLEGFSDFSQEELRAIDYKIKKTRGVNTFQGIAGGSSFMTGNQTLQVIFIFLLRISRLETILQSTCSRIPARSEPRISLPVILEEEIIFLSRAKEISK